MSNFEELLRKSLEERRNQPLEAVTDLNAIITEMAAAVSSVTGGKLRLLLDPLKPKGDSGPTFALVLRSANEDAALRVIEFTPSGYPATVWFKYANWDQENDEWFRADTVQALREHLQKMARGPQSELVRLIANELALAEEAEREPALAG